MWFDGIRQPNTLYLASVSRGKDSTAMLRAIQLMGWPLDGICAVDIWFDDETPAELPPLVTFKDEWDRKCLETFGLPVTRLCAETTADKKHQPFLKAPCVTGGGTSTHTQTDSTCKNPINQNTDKEASTDSLNSAEVGVKTLKSTLRVKQTYCDIFYRPISTKTDRTKKLQYYREGKDINLCGYPMRGGQWCTGELKQGAFRTAGGGYAGRQVRLPDSENKMVSEYAQREHPRQAYGFPQTRGNWCTALKTTAPLFG